MTGMPIYVDPLLAKTERFQSRFPRSRSHRIRKKWRKRARNFSTRRVPQAFQIRDPFTGRMRIVCCPAFFRQMKEASHG